MLVLRPASPLQHCLKVLKIAERLERDITWVEVGQLPNGPRNSLKWQHIGVSVRLLYTHHIPSITQFFPALHYLPPCRHPCVHLPPPSKYIATLLPMHHRLSSTWKPRSHTLSLSSYVIPRPYALLCHDFNRHSFSPWAQCLLLVLT